LSTKESNSFRWKSHYLLFENIIHSFNCSYHRFTFQNVEIIQLLK
jgi:hypothetical protein